MRAAHHQRVLIAFRGVRDGLNERGVIQGEQCPRLFDLRRESCIKHIGRGQAEMDKASLRAKLLLNGAQERDYARGEFPAQFSACVRRCSGAWRILWLPVE